MHECLIVRRRSSTGRTARSLLACSLVFGLPNNVSDACHQVSVPYWIAPPSEKSRSRRSAFHGSRGSCEWPMQRSMVVEEWTVTMMSRRATTCRTMSCDMHGCFHARMPCVLLTHVVPSLQSGTMKCPPRQVSWRGGL